MNDLLTVINENINTSFYTMDEAAQYEVAEKVLDKLFEMTIGKYNKINFMDIEKTRGDITKLKYYKNLVECLNTLNEIHKVTGKLGSLSTIQTALHNLQVLKPSFEKSFRIQNKSGMMIYNLISYAIMEATSYMIASSINFISEEEISITDIGGSEILVDSLNKFNVLVSDGTIYRFIVEVEKESTNNESMNEAGGANIASWFFSPPKSIKSIGARVGLAVALSAVLIGLLKSIIPLVRSIAYYIYETKHKLSEAAAIQAYLLELNIKTLRDNNGDIKVIARQQKWVDRFKKIAESFALDSDKSKRDSEAEMRKDKVDIDSIVI